MKKLNEKQCLMIGVTTKPKSRYSPLVNSDNSNFSCGYYSSGSTQFYNYIYEESSTYGEGDTISVIVDFKSSTFYRVFHCL